MNNRAYQTLRKAGHISWKDIYPSRPALGYATVANYNLFKTGTDIMKSTHTQLLKITDKMLPDKLVQLIIGLI